MNLNGSTAVALPTRKTVRQRAITREQGLSRRPAEPLIGDLLHVNEITLMYGQPGSFKSFVAIGAACSVALGRDWGEHRVPQPRHVMYVAAEGGTGAAWRIEAWCLANGVDPEHVWANLTLIAEPIQLIEPQDVDELAAWMTETETGLVVLDTKRRVSEGYLEDKADDQTMAYGRVAQLQRATNSAVLVIHHPRKDGTTPAGSGAWEGNPDMVVQVVRKGESRAIGWNVEKSKETEDHITFGFEVTHLTFDRDDAPERGSLVAQPTGRTAHVAAKTGEHEIKLTEPQFNTMKELAFFGPGRSVEIAVRRGDTDPIHGWKITPSTLRNHLTKLERIGFATRTERGEYSVSEAGLSWVPSSAPPDFRCLKLQVRDHA